MKDDYQWKQLICFILIFNTKKELDYKKYLNNISSSPGGLNILNIKFFNKSWQDNIETAVYFELTTKLELRINNKDERLEYPNYLLYEEEGNKILPMLYLKLPESHSKIIYNRWSVKEYQLPSLIVHYKFAYDLSLNISKSEEISNSNIKSDVLNSILNKDELSFLLS